MIIEWAEERKKGKSFWVGWGWENDPRKLDQWGSLLLTLAFAVTETPRARLAICLTAAALKTKEVFYLSHNVGPGQFKQQKRMKIHILYRQDFHLHDPCTLLWGAASYSPAASLGLSAAAPSTHIYRQCTGSQRALCYCVFRTRLGLAPLDKTPKSIEEWMSKALCQQLATLSRERLERKL